MRIALASFIVVAASVSVAADFPAPSRLTSHRSHQAAEAVRLRSHFDSVRNELLLADVSTLTSAQRASRGRLVGWLQEYRDSGQFPLNDGYARERVPIFRDRDGTLCAMAYLVERSGRGDIVNMVARTRNLAYIPDLASDPRLAAWLDSVGLTVTEAARIQPTYGPPAPEPVVQEAMDGRFLVASAATGGAAIAASVMNLMGTSTVRGTVGVISGLLAAGLGAANIGVGADRRTTRRIAAADMVAGGFAFGLGMRSLMRPAAVVAQRPIELTPMVRSVDGRTSTGMMLRARF